MPQYGVCVILCAVLCRAQHSTQYNTPSECFNINITLAGLNYKLPDDGRRPKHVPAI